MTISIQQCRGCGHWYEPNKYPCPECSSGSIADFKTVEEVIGFPEKTRLLTDIDINGLVG